jgi:hypothetical protein
MQLAHRFVNVLRRSVRASLLPGMPSLLVIRAAWPPLCRLIAQPSLDDRSGPLIAVRLSLCAVNGYETASQAIHVRTDIGLLRIFGLLGRDEINCADELTHLR